MNLNQLIACWVVVGLLINMLVIFDSVNIYNKSHYCGNTKQHRRNRKNGCQNISARYCKNDMVYDF